MIYPILTVEIRFEQDIVLARQRARQIANLLGFDIQEQTRIATAVSEVARHAFQYAGKGKFEFLIKGQSPQVFVTRISDSGEGIANLQTNSHNGMGLVGARRLMDEVIVESSPGRGTGVQLIKQFPKHGTSLTKTQLNQIVDQLTRLPKDPFAEIQQQNQELLQTLEELQKRQEELAQLNQELEDTNRGVIALYAELNDKAESLKRASELKTRFLSNMSHEFRTPLNAILSLSDMLLNHLDGDLTAEQEKQVTFIRKSAASLTDLVNDLLDLAKVEAGKVDVRVTAFEVTDLFSALRGMLRPLLTNNAVALIFAEPSAIPTLKTDEGKVSQIMRNFISNALKYTEKGEVRVTAKMGANQTVIFSVADTGIGIAPENQSRIFEEFVQVNHPLQKRVKGTGLGLPLCKKLSELLGGSVALQSTLGVGSTFSVTLPIVYCAAPETDFGAGNDGDNFTNNPKINNQNAQSASNLLKKILIIDDEEVSRYTIKSWLADIRCTAIEAADGYEGLYRARTEQPQAILLDLLMPGLTGFTVLEQLKSDPATSAIPVIIVTSKRLEAQEYEQLAARAVAIVSKESNSREEAIAQLRAAFLKAGLNF
ncbi:ATP-binding protein [Microseira wollei]|uniref:histidine kinase n=1 Tax=Microseira wollei NIES-4236 TaxID=2530354 RepID=A0AAV3X0U0_9CYAN|nr:ATP-binding protein [Microseira wollei]GET36302.1 hybrid histidine kinase [Microseira wollei NIES-4236]